MLGEVPPPPATRNAGSGPSGAFSLYYINRASVVGFGTNFTLSLHRKLLIFLATGFCKDVISCVTWYCLICMRFSMGN